MYTLGIDIGSASSKAVILADGLRPVAGQAIQAGTGSSGPKQAVERALDEAKLTLSDIAASVATGYGRFTCELTDRQVSEISCHARGVSHQLPSARLVIDIGGQDAKVIRLDAQGAVWQFLMNEKCAAGTGRFLEVMSRVLEISLREMGAYHDRSSRPAAVSSTCTVFAESEVISLLAAGAAKPDIIAGIHRSVAVKVCGLASRVGWEDDIAMSGGVARNQGVVKALEAELGRPIKITPEPQLAGALGAALYAFDQYQSKNKTGG
ncbi:MAG: acyl-CoA dehydratase activase [Peptococcaceae bacterium]|jgi:predicted CoA-substrate-specific enzyme activase|nr:acyl-CoA dehydratase activase [Peptococcaceae bacterium]